MEAVRGHHISPLLGEKVADLMVVLLRREKGSVYVCTAVYLCTAAKVIREKSRGEGSLLEQDTIENVSEPDFFFNFLRKKIYIF